MYKAFLNEICILDANLDIVLEDPFLELADSAAGSFSFTIYPDNPGYAQIQANLMKTSALKVMWEDEILYKGRITSIKQTWDKALMVESEGDLALLDDTIQRPAEYHEMTVIGYVTKLIELHNAKAGSDKQFQVGSVTVTDSNDSLYRYTNWESTLTTFKEDLLESLGGHLRVRYDSRGNRLLDYLAGYPRVSEQKIEFGSNLLDYSDLTDGTCIATVCIPLGAKQDEAEIEALEERLTIKDVNSGSDELLITQAVNAFGRITKTVTWDNVNTPSVLKAKGQKWLEDNQYSEMTLELSAVDLADFGIEADHLRLLDKIRCTSKPHGMDRDFPITEVKLNLLDPEQNVYVLGSKIKGFATGSSRAQKQIQQQLSNQPSKSHVLKLALDNATSLINMAGDDGCVVLSKNEILVMDRESKDEAERLWRWNINGLGYSSNGYQGPFELAITMDGTIAGRFIAAGTVGADQISVSYTSTQEKKWQDELENNYWTTVEVETAIENSADSVKIYAQETAVNTFNTKISDYYKKSEIDVTVDGINSSVTTRLGGYYTKSEVDQRDNAIISTVNTKVGTTEFGTLIEQSASHVKIAWNKISSVIQFENAQMNIYNGSSKIISFNSTGMDLFYSNYQVGSIGTSCWSGNSSMRGLVFDLDPDGAYMCWAAKSSSSDTSYSTVLTYTQRGYSDYLAGYLNLGANLDCHWYNVINGNFKGCHFTRDGDQGTNYNGTLYIPVSTSGIAPGGSYISVNLKDGLLI